MSERDKKERKKRKNPHWLPWLSGKSWPSMCQVVGSISSTGLGVGGGVLRGQDVKEN